MLQRRKQRKKRHDRMRVKTRKTSVHPRLCVFRSNKYVYAQLIDDRSGNTLAYIRGKKTVKHAKETGKSIAKKALEKKIETVVFDRSGYKYHGRVKALAEAAREEGLKF